MTITLPTSLLKKIVIAGIFSFIICSINWEEVKGQYFQDKTRTTSKLQQEFYDVNLSFDYSSLIFNLTHETLWNQGLRFVSTETTFKIEVILVILSFITIFVFTFIVISESKIIYLFLLLSPSVIDLIFSQYRISLAISLIYVAAIVNVRAIKVLLFLSSFFIHTASFIFAVILILGNYALKKHSNNNNPKKLFITATFSAFLIFLIIGPLGKIILNYLGNRRADYSYISSGILMTIFWLSFLYFYLIQYKTILSIKVVLYSYVLILLFILLSISNFYGARFIAIGFPLIILSISKMKYKHRLLAFTMLFSYNLIYWTLWIQ